jgi:hypothetical protein
MSRRFFRKVVLGVFIIFGPLSLGTFLVSKQNKMPKIPQNFQAQEFQTEKNEIQIGIISDTHIPSRAKNLPKEIFEVFKNVDLIIHAGDIENLETLKELEKIAPVFSVEGNMDQKETKEKLSEGISLKIYNWKIGIIHSPFSFWLGSHFNFVQEKMAQRLAEKENFDILIFGHTHRPFLKTLDLKEKKVLLINPGSATIPFFTEPSIAILRITKDSFKGEIVNIKR